MRCAHHMYGVTSPKKLDLAKPPVAPVRSWEWELDVDGRSVDRLCEMLRKMGKEHEHLRWSISRKFILAETLKVPLNISLEEHKLIERDYRWWAAREKDPAKKARLTDLANLAHHIAVNERRKAKPPTRKRPPKRKK